MSKFIFRNHEDIEVTIRKSGNYESSCSFCKSWDTPLFTAPFETVIVTEKCRKVFGFFGRLKDVEIEKEEISKKIYICFDCVEQLQKNEAIKNKV